MQPGDITVCAYCGVGLVLTVDGFQPASAEDLDRLPPELRVVHDAWEARNPPPTTSIDPVVTGDLTSICIYDTMYMQVGIPSTHWRQQ